jgi:hydrogenase maturation factor
LSKELGLGKISKKIFQRTVRPHIPLNKDLELDGAHVKLKENTIIAHSPSIGLPIETLGFFAFHYSASNVAVKFGKPRNIVLGIYLPLKTQEKDLETIVRSFGSEAKKYSVNVIAGQTATYSGLKIPLITTTCLGESLRHTRQVCEDDLIAIIGEIGGEGAWLKSLRKGEISDKWRKFTPLPKALLLQLLPEVKLMHDVSEGGLSGALHEITESIHMKIQLESVKLNITSDWDNSINKVLFSPSYGTLITIFEPSGKKKICDIVKKAGYPFTVLQPLQEGKGLYVDDCLVDEHSRIDLDEIYGSFEN